MAASAPSVPRLDENALIGIWVETSLWGTYCIIYAVAMYVLFKKLQQPVILATTSTFLFMMGTAHVSLSLSQLLDAFIRIPNPEPPLYSILYWSNYASGKATAKTVLYDTSVFTQDLVLIWRLYVVWSRNWKVVVFPLLVEVAHMATAYALTGLLARPGSNIQSPTIVHFGPVGWVLDLAINICVTLAISGRLWYMGKQVNDIAINRNRYLTTILTFVESGAIFAAFTIVMLTVYETGSVLALNLIDISTQLAIMTPLLIIARVGIGMVHGLPDAVSFAYPSQRSMGTHSHTGYEMGSFATKRPTDNTVIISKEYGTTVDDVSTHKGTTIV
ncbi:hypothetical protein CPB84DRAFT_1733191 [Gymnopilus junonius]|uniref:Uncharacterized protein n=1 Tax=Gymnopilus junonius TaxID=109634 RepID=A0A9P5NIG1_GYMJU|nr:hypothetical protein CPB84DRAFT_1733191 [Gymnopilus junonius]